MTRALAAVMLEWRKQTMFAADNDYVFASERKNGTQHAAEVRLHDLDRLCAPRRKPE